MTPKRSYYCVGIPYSLLALCALAFVIWWAPPSPVFFSTVPLMLLGMWLDRTPVHLTPEVVWSYSEVFGTAVVVMSPIGSAPLAGWIYGLLIALTPDAAPSRRLGRAIANAGLLPLAWASSGIVFEVLRPSVAGPSFDLLYATATCFIAQLAINSFLTAVALRILHGRRTESPIAESNIFLGPTAAALSITAGVLIASTHLTGLAFAPIAAVSAAVLVLLPLLNLKLRLQRNDIRKGVMQALEAHAPTEPTAPFSTADAVAVHIGTELGLRGDEVEQLRYLVMLYVMTDRFALHQLPVGGAFADYGMDHIAATTLLCGLFVEDLARPAIIRLAEALAILTDDQCDPCDELSQENALIQAILTAEPRTTTWLPQGYAALMRYNPESFFQRPAAWLRRRTLRHA